VGLYGAAGNLASVALLGMPLLFWVLVPAAARADAGEPGEMDGLVASALRVSFLVTVPIAIVSYLGADTWLRLLFGEAYAPAAPVLQILTPTFVLTYASTISAIALIQRGRIWTVAAVSVTGVVTTLLLAAILVPWGARHLGTSGAAQGAAWATLATEAAVALALGWAYGSGWRNRALWRTIAALAAGVAAASAAAALLPGPEAIPVAALAFAAVVCIARGVDREDVRFCRQVLGRPRRRLALSTAVEAS
jgi:PST family polysaccharide transporter